jgi:hypothetical protein
MTLSDRNAMERAAAIVEPSIVQITADGLRRRLSS